MDKRESTVIATVPGIQGSSSVIARYVWIHQRTYIVRKAGEIRISVHPPPPVPIRNIPLFNFEGQLVEGYYSVVPSKLNNGN